MPTCLTRSRRASVRVRVNGAAAGFTLAEMLIVVLVLGIVAMSVAPILGTAVQEARLSGAAGDVVAALEYARMRAAVSGAAVRVHFADDGRRVRVDRLAAATNLVAAGDLVPARLVETGIYAAVPHPFEKHTNAFLRVGAPDDGVRIATADFGGTNEVVFEAFGVPLATGRVVLVCGRLKRIVSVEDATGRIVVGE